MATDILDKNGNELDDVFEPRIQGDFNRGVDCGHIAADNGEDLVDRFASLATGDAVGYNTDLLDADTDSDLSAIFAAKDTRWDYQLTNNSWSDSNSSGGSATVTLQFETDGRFRVVRENNTNPAPTGEYARNDGALDSDIGDNHEIRATQVSGDAPSLGDPLDTWLALTQIRSWSFSANAGGSGSDSSTGEIKVEIRRIQDNAVKVSADLEGSAFSTTL